MAKQTKNKQQSKQTNKLYDLNILTGAHLPRKHDQGVQDVPPVLRACLHEDGAVRKFFLSNNLLHTGLSGKYMYKFPKFTQLVRENGGW